MSRERSRQRRRGPGNDAGRPRRDLPADDPRRLGSGSPPEEEARPWGQSEQAGAVNRSRPIYDQGGSRRGDQGGMRRGDQGGSRRGNQGGMRRRGRPDNGVPGSRGRDGSGRRPTGRPGGEPERPGIVLPENPREAALRVLHAVDTRNAFSDRLLDGAHGAARDPRDEALLHELVKGTLRWRGRIDWVLDPLVHIGLSQVQPWIRNVLRLGAYQILFLDRVPAHAAVDEAVKLAHQYGHPGTAGLVNSVLRRLAEGKDAIALPAGDDAASLAAWGSHPVWMVERWLERFGPEAARALLLADNRAARVGLRANRLRATREQLIERLVAEGVAAESATLAPELAWAGEHVVPGRLQAFRDGLCTVQDESECLVSRLVAPQAHERILDLCAAPGGKSTHIAELMGDEGEVWAMERSETRAPAIETATKRLGLHAVHVVQGDGRSYDFPMPFDRVLVDAPCSGLGVLARRADARWRKGPEVFRELLPVQLDLLQAGGRRARPGGVLVYSVCSFEPEETVELVERFLRASPQFVLEAAHGFVPDEIVDEDGFMRVLPHLQGCDGAFAARFRKT
ncbi:MAG TPA: 16S rRNA (cytosine(967)-C(5))-methyltransferase RsmB [Candidatus Eisenbacteria bacterium]